MTNILNIETAMAELGPLSEHIDLITKDAEATRWYVSYQGQHFCLQYQASSERLYFINEVAPEEGVAVLDASVVNQWLLNYNALWELTGGLRFARNEDDQLQQIMDIAVEGLSAHTIVSVLNDMSEKNRVWVNCLIQPEFSRSEKNHHSNDLFNPQHIIA